MESAINGFHRDKQGDWVVELSCGHSRHLRHQPPFKDVAWVENDEQRNSRIGDTIDCPECDRKAEDPGPERDLRIAAAVKAACLQTAIAAYQHGQMSGLCQEGAIDLALDAIRALDPQTVLEQLPD